MLGIEPSTNHVLGRKFAEERGELMFLEHAETRHYRTRLSVLDGAAAIAAARRAIEALHPPPADFSAPTEVPQTRRPPMTEVHCVANPRALVGEGPVWDDRRQVLWWIDVKDPRLFRYDPASGAIANSACPSASAASRCGAAA